MCIGFNFFVDVHDGCLFPSVVGRPQTPMGSGGIRWILDVLALYVESLETRHVFCER